VPITDRRHDELIALARRPETHVVVAQEEANEESAES
jgi:hypothetical protein